MRSAIILWLGLFLTSFTGAALGAQRQAIQGRPALVRGLAPVDHLPKSMRLKLAIELPLRHQEALTDLLGRLYDPRSPDYRQFLAPEQFAERFGPTEQD